ncbi:MAG: hypothetical protein AAFP81_02020 [Pseudomonadota bacterium]
MNRPLCLALFLLFASATLANAQDEKSATSSIVFSWYPTKDACNGSIAETVSLDALLRSPEDFQETCVRTEGFYKAGALFMHAHDLRRKYPSQNEVSAKRRLGVYAEQSLMEQLTRSQGNRVELVGLVSHCDALWGENTIMVMGYCHHTGGPIIGLTQE